MFAVCYGATDCVKLLLARGGDTLELDAQNRFLDTVLHWAAYWNHPEIVQLLLLAGADSTIRSNSGARTPLNLARIHTCHACIALLQAALAKPQRPRSLLKARALLDATHAIRTARINARDKEGLPLAGQRDKAMAAAPVYLKQRVGQSRELPRVDVVEGEQESEEQLAACVKYALGLEGGGGVVLFEGPELAVGMLPEVFVELCELLVPKWDRANV